MLSGGCASAGDTSNLTAVSTYFLRNAGGDQGGAIRITGFASLTVGKGSAFAGNTALGGGGIWGELFSKAAVTGTKFIQNSAAFYVSLSPLHAHRTSSRHVVQPRERGETGWPASTAALRSPA